MSWLADIPLFVWLTQNAWRELLFFVILVTLEVLLTKALFAINYKVRNHYGYIHAESEIRDEINFFSNWIVSFEVILTIVMLLLRPRASYWVMLGILLIFLFHIIFYTIKTIANVDR
jgi:hypothetical protein